MALSALLFVHRESALLILGTMRTMVSVLRALSVVSFGSFVGLMACGGSPNEGLGNDGLGGDPGSSGSSGAQQSSGNNASGGTSNGGSCTPKCDGKVCGGDSCGGECGTCGGKQTCNAGGQCETPVPAGATCPPTGATGKTVGKVIADGNIPLKQGGTYPIRANCAKPIYILGVTESCGICMAHMAEWTKPGGFFEQLKNDGVDVVLIHATNKSDAVPSPQETATLVSNYNLSRFIVGTDAGGNGFNSFIGQRTGYGGARIAITVKPGNIIGQVGQIDSELDVRKGLGL